METNGTERRKKLIYILFPAAPLLFWQESKRYKKRYCFISGQYLIAMIAGLRLLGDYLVGGGDDGVGGGGDGGVDSLDGFLDLLGGSLDGSLSLGLFHGCKFLLTS